jgi:hypothetical protein
VDAYPIVAPRRLPEADGKALDEVGDAGEFAEYEPLRFRGRILRGDLPGRVGNFTLLAAWKCDIPTSRATKHRRRRGAAGRIARAGGSLRF